MTVTHADLAAGIRDRRIAQVSSLTTPASLLERLPLEPGLAEVVVRGRAETGAILKGTDDRLLVVVGPCSVHDADAAMEYARRLCGKASEHAADLCVAMRVYLSLIHI